MRILAIETSCDDTAIAIIETTKKRDFEGLCPDRMSGLTFRLLSNVVSSQIKIHRKYGGVWPTMAKREHQRNLIPVLTRALKKVKLLNPKFKIINPKQITNSKFQILNKILERESELLKQFLKFVKKHEKPEIDAIAITVGPGLEPCLWTGINLAKALAFTWNLPVIPINHIEGHILANWLSPIDNNFQFSISNFKKMLPAISLVVSGGHTQLILVKKMGSYKIIGQTRDDAAGECFDKIARILGLSYPGGPEIARRASQFRGKSPFALPRPMINSNNFDFSFSGLKTAVLYQTIKDKKKTQTKKYAQEMCAAVQEAIIDVLVAKTLKTAKKYKAKTVLLGGGVSANEELRRQLGDKIKKDLPNTKYYIPDTEYCTDNAAMIALAGFFNFKKKTKNWKNLSADGNLRL